jgi:putative alpha-1,2-mannosidase
MKNGAPNHPYVQRVTLNGVSLNTPFITYGDIMAGKELVFEMGAKKTVYWHAP